MFVAKLKQQHQHH